MTADLHVHSTASDGTLSPHELVSLAAVNGVEVLAIADHDSVAGIPDAVEAARGTSVLVIPAVELSACTPDGRDVHILGYGLDFEDATLSSRLAELRDARLERARTMVGILSADGYTVSLDDVLTLSDGGAVGRSHIARALVDSGHADDVADAFNRLIGHGKDYYVAKSVKTPGEAMRIIREAGGVPVVAHPGVNRADAIIHEHASGLLGGIEALHADHTPEQKAHYLALAESLRLLVTGGTDFHGPHAHNPPLGSVDIPERHVIALLESCGIAR